MDKGAGPNFRRARKQLLHESKYGCEKHVLVAQQFRLAQSRSKCVQRDVELRDWVVTGDVADCEDFEQFTDVVAVVHACFLGVVEGVEDIRRVAFRELDFISYRDQ